MRKNESDKALKYVERYFEEYSKIESNERKISQLKKQLERKINEKRELRKINIDPELGYETSYEERVQTSSSGIAKSESEIIKYITKLEKDEQNIREEIDKLEDENTKIKIEFEDLKLNIDRLDEFSKSVLTMLCRDKRSKKFICIDKFGSARSRTPLYTNLNKSLRSIINWNWINE